jgi:hypothetical protein
MSGSFDIMYKQFLPKLFLPAGPSAAKHGPNSMNAYEIFLSLMASKSEKLILLSLPKLLQMICLYAKFM